MQDEKKLKIQEKALDFVTNVYKFSVRLPQEEKYNIISQIRRAVVSIPLNISEGASANTNKEFNQFLGYAYRSAKEVITCFEIIKRLGLIKEQDATLIELELKGQELCKMIYTLRSKIITND